MKRYILITAVFAAGFTARAGAFDPTWAGDDGSVYAVWDNWANYTQGSASQADYTEAYAQDGSAYSFAGDDRPDVLSYSAVNGYDTDGNSWLELGSADDLSFWMPAVSGQETTEIVVQLTYWDDDPGNGGNADWRAGFDLYPQLSDTSSGTLIGSEYLGEDYDTSEGLITEGWSLIVSGSTDGFFADFTVDQESLDGGGVYVEEVSIDALSYAAVPEPASVISIIFGGVILAVTRRRMRR